MANKEQLEILKQGVEIWNNWRRAHRNEVVELTGANLSGANLVGANLRQVNFAGANLRAANLTKAKIMNADIRSTDFFNANLKGADLTQALIHRADFTEANLRGADLSEAWGGESKFNGANLFKARLNKAELMSTDFTGADLREANLSEANLSGACLYGANLSRGDLSGSNLIAAICVETNFSKANIENAQIYGISIWGIKINGLKQENLIITRKGEAIITVDNLEVAQFIYLMLNNEKIRDVIGTIAKKGVLILGRFTPERKKILDAIRDKLRECDLVPMMFDFEKVDSRDFTETIKILAGMSRFVIADISNPKSSPLELQATVPDYQIPFVSIIQKGEDPFSMFNDLTKYPWVLEPIEYDSEIELMEYFQKGIIDRALEEDERLFEIKTKNQKPPKNIKDFK
jgi:uncharacterized protein YjbI with pentapeptide repeats